jgi:hypothetical protein
MFVYSMLFLLATCADEGLAVLPATLTFDAKGQAQRVLVEKHEPQGFAGDLTSHARFESSDPSVATVSDDGTVTSVGPGQATLSARVGDREASARVNVGGSGTEKTWSFRNDVLPVLTRLGCNSGACHGAAAGKNGFRLTLRGYGPEIDHDVLTRQTRGRRIHKTKPAESLLLLKATGALEHGGGARMATGSPEYQILSEWIGAGSPGPGNEDAKLLKIEALPGSARLAAGQSQQVLVFASYSDGRTRDVTRWAKFESTDTGVAQVDDQGLINVVGPGEGAVTVWFSSLVDLVTISSPYEDAVNESVYANAPRMNPIDELNLKKLQSLVIAPSPPCDDATFLRRATLDATGTLPTRAQVDAFLVDVRSNKRAELIEALINSQEYVDYWTYKWCDVLLVSSKKLGGPAVWSFYRFVRESVAANLPWDEFARRIVTAKGSTLSNGAANYFVLHRDPIDLAESTSVAFLGLSLTCARCHNHPMEKWTQDQYYGFANLFSRISLKDGVGATGAVTAGDVVVSPAPDGDLSHPRRGVVMAPQPLDAQALPPNDRGDRRVALADWLASPENPYFDRAVVNRVWANFMGRGLVDPEDDLRATNPPSDPELLDWLVDDFRAHKRDLKYLIRLIMNSGVYQRSSDAVLGNQVDLKLLSHYLPRRLPAEVLLDAIDRVTEVPTGYTGYPDGWRSLQLPDSKVENTFLDSFGRPLREAVCSCERSDEPSIAQALNLANGSTLNEKLRSEKGATARLVEQNASDEQVIDHLFKSALGRPATADEAARLTPQLSIPAEEAGDVNRAKAARRQAIEDLYWATLTSKEFLFSH